jgi:fermentation-respiration switch protein FrsA (DUF1100 family)
MVKRIILLVFGLYLLLLVGFYLFQEKVIFRPKKLAKDYIFSFDKKFEEINLSLDDNSIINAIHFKVKNPKGIILYYHGNKGNLKRWGPMISPFTEYGYDVFVMDYRGYGKSNGERNEKNLYNDALLSYNYVKRLFDEEKITVYGRSLGGTFATFVASQNNPKQLILEAPFYNLLDLSYRKFRFLPYKNLLRYNFNSNNFITNVECPITIFHGDEDRLIPLKSGKKLYEASKKSHSKFVIIKNGTHNNLMTSDLYEEKIAQLLN